MSLKNNIIASYISQFYTTLIGILILPLYIKYMGAEAYGLVGFFAMLQVWFQLLDMGLSPTISRETARYCGGATDALSLRRLLRTLEGIFLVIALLGAVVIIASAYLIATDWLKVETLPIAEVIDSIRLIGVIIALRWISSLYRGVITGFEQLVWLGGFNVIIATIRFVLVIPYFIWVDTSPVAFFSYQLGAAIIESLILILKSYQLLPKVKVGQYIPWQWKPLKNVLKFSLSIAFTSSVWVLVTQTDKLMLSKLLPLKEYGYFTLAVLAASGILMISGPISSALLPRLTKLNAENDEVGFIRLYRQATQFVTIIAIPASLVLALFSKQVLWVWTGDIDIVNSVTPILTLYALGNGILAFGAFPYYLQYAKGDLTLHLIGSALFVAFLIPSLILATFHYGMMGAGYAWLISNVIYFLFWVPIVHRKFVKGLHYRWLFKDIGGIALIGGIVSFLFYQLTSWPENRIFNMAIIASISFCMLILSMMGSKWARNRFLTRLKNRKVRIFQCLRKT
ncbi:polysaccharide biosynthesis protein [Candidatus Thiomargarita nelsonii]|uniref:Polysaccharide biosynthesis protein n=1 Tax=Candidatus Thiomargarita nelsonii TaxID=1003181 RepID=A0A0A6PCI5_9GAMM|nr:polysaccharide biosynthesis protein [Candidatus Thiomargarita nelsonii]